MGDIYTYGAQRRKTNTNKASGNTSAVSPVQTNMNSPLKYNSTPTYTYTPSQGAPYADPIPSKVSSSGSSLIADFYKTQANNDKVANTNMTLGNTPAPSTKTTATPATSSLVTPAASVSSSASTQSSSLTKDKATGIIYKEDGTIYSQPSIYNAYGKNGALAKSEAAKATGVLDPTTRKALEGIASWGDPEYIEYAKSIAGDDLEALKRIESDYATAMLAAKELKYWDELEKSKEKKISLADLMALFNDADNYTEWLDKYGTDTEAARAEAYKNRQAELERNRSTYGRNAENLAQLGLTNSGYSDYLDGVGYAAYIAGLSDADSQKAMQDAEYARQYAQYLTEKEAEAKQQAMALYGSVMSGELTAEQAMQYAKFLGASDDDAQAVYNTASSVASTVTQNKTNAELNAMATSVLDLITKNGYGVETAIKILYPDATEGQIAYVKKYVNDVEDLNKKEQMDALLDSLDTELNTISQNISYGNGASDIGSYEAKFNEVINSGADTAAIETIKEKISACVLSHLKALYDYDNKTATEEKYLASYIAASYGNEEDKSGMTAYSALNDTDKDDFLRTTIDELFNAGVLTEKDYNDIKGVAFGIDLENAKNIKDNAELMEKADAGWYGTESNIASIKNTIADIIAPIEITKESKSGTIIGQGIESQPAQFEFSIKTKDSKLAYNLNLENYNYWIGNNSYKEISSEKIPAEEGFFAYDDNIFYRANYTIQTGENSSEQMPLIFVLNQSKNTSITYQDGKKTKTLTPEQLKSIIPMLKDYLLEFTIPASFTPTKENTNG